MNTTLVLSADAAAPVASGALAQPMLGRCLLLAALLIAEAGCVKQWGPLSEVAERVISSCSGRKCAPETAQAKCLADMRENAQAQRDAVPASCFMWNTP